ncbi:hypothetical protein D0817_14930 [Flavobacterium cupreum]|uniref:Uncharacterized protein n=2 Tax=Flavobacterium cupreum TaxID=2133766 RepID=A0A434A597_9FLAO|nr:hypothetical protein D0817_14930 [Flavobacterium cupreum]
MLIACKQDKIISKAVSYKKQEIQKSKDQSVSSLSNKDFSLQIVTRFSTDTLNVIDYKEDRYSSPIITFQKLLFYNKNLLVKEHKLPLKNINKRTISGKILSATETPIYKMCLFNNSDQHFYIVHGSDYCSGSHCPEFIGIYSMKGDAIYEGFSNEKKTFLLKKVVIKNRIDLNKLSNCVNVDIYK